MKPLDWYVNADLPPDVATQAVGALPLYLDADSADPAWLQIEEASRSGWNPHGTPEGFELHMDDILTFPGLPPVPPAAYAYHLGEKILAYPAGWVVIVQLNQSYSIARVS
jgi:hypothetical protein